MRNVLVSNADWKLNKSQPLDCTERVHIDQTRQPPWQSRNAFLASISCIISLPTGSVQIKKNKKSKSLPVTERLSPITSSSSLVLYNIGVMWFLLCVCCRHDAVWRTPVGRWCKRAWQEHAYRFSRVWHIAMSGRIPALQAATMTFCSTCRPGFLTLLQRHPSVIARSYSAGQPWWLWTCPTTAGWGRSAERQGHLCSFCNPPGNFPCWSREVGWLQFGHLCWDFNNKKKEKKKDVYCGTVVTWRRA